MTSNFNEAKELGIWDGLDNETTSFIASQLP